MLLLGKVIFSVVLAYTKLLVSSVKNGNKGILTVLALQINYLLGG